MPHTKVGLNPTIREQTWFEDFQDGHHGGHLWYQNKTILTILNLYVAPMPPIKFQLNPTYSLGEVVWRFSRRLTWCSSWISEWNNFRNSKSPCGPNASHQVWAQSDLGFGSRCGPSWTAKHNNLSICESLCCSHASHQDFQDGHHGGHLWYQNKTILTILNLYVAPMLPIKFRLNPTYGLGGDVVWRIQRWLPWQSSWISERNNFSNSESFKSLQCLLSKFPQSNLRFGRRCRLKNFKMAAMVAITDIGTELF